MDPVIRANFTLPSSVYAELRQKIAPRKRSRFVTSAVKSQLKKTPKQKETYAQAMRRLAGSISAKKHPKWKDIDSVVAWVNEGRAAANRDYSYIPHDHK